MTDHDDESDDRTPAPPGPATPDEPSRPRRLSRRSVLWGGAATAVVAVAGGFAVGHTVGTGSTPGATRAAPKGRIAYASTGVTAPAASVVTRDGSLAHGLLMVTPQGGTFHGAILDNLGEPVWLQPDAAAMTDLRAQTYQGRPVLTYWTGEVYKHHGRGRGVILDDTYTEIATVHAGGGMTVDLHEFTLTDRGTALVCAYEPVQTDLRPIGGPRRGWVFECHAQEIDIATGAVLWDWASLAHAPVSDTYQGLLDDPGQDGSSAEAALDYFHMNAVADAGDRIYISGRHTHAIYAIERGTGRDLWRMGGRRSTLRLPEHAQFAWQHNIRPHADGTLTLFDNHLKSSVAGVHSRGLVLRADEKAGTVRTVRRLRAGHLGTAMGNVQMLDGGRAVVGWGTSPHVTEHTADGDVAYDLSLSGMSYRAFRMPWQATPARPPALVTQRTVTGRLRAHVSWNGATDVAAWRLRTGAASDTLTTAATVPRRGFESTLDVAGARFAVADALDADGRTLGSSAVVSS